MSLFMLAARRAHWLGSPPPKKLTDRFLRHVGTSRRPWSSWPMTALNHAAFGAAAGIPFALSSGRIGTAAGRTIVGGIYGATVWAGMYQGVLPALGLMPRPRWDRPGRPTSMAIAHLIYGAVLGAAVDAGNHHRSESVPNARST
jgi:hypothetical protein